MQQDKIMSVFSASEHQGRHCTGYRQWIFSHYCDLDKNYCSHQVKCRTGEDIFAHIVTYIHIVFTSHVIAIIMWDKSAFGRLGNLMKSSYWLRSGSQCLPGRGWGWGKGWSSYLYTKRVCWRTIAPTAINTCTKPGRTWVDCVTKNTNTEKQASLEYCKISHLQ